MSSAFNDWQNFFTAELGALAALTGLIVVAISINLSRILSIARLPGRAGEALIMLVGALVIASVALVPHQPAALLGAEILGIGVAMIATPLVNHLHHPSSDPGVTPAKKWIRLGVGLVGSLPFVVAGVLLISGSYAGYDWAAAGVIASLVAGVWNAWVLLVEILR
jgi:hypothetical protein